MRLNELDKTNTATEALKANFDYNFDASKLSRGQTKTMMERVIGQGCMISLQTGLKRKNKINSIVGYSGKIIDTNHLRQNINSRPNVILMHGDKAEIVPVNFLLEAKEFFKQNNYKIESKIFKNCEHRIPTEGSSLGLEFIKKNLY